jgi:hypothetical protein
MISGPAGENKLSARLPSEFRLPTYYFDHSRSRARATYASRRPPLTLSGFGHVAPLPAGSILAALPSTRAAPARTCSTFFISN